MIAVAAICELRRNSNIDRDFFGRIQFRNATRRDVKIIEDKPIVCTILCAGTMSPASKTFFQQPGSVYDVRQRAEMEICVFVFNRLQFGTG